MSLLALLLSDEQAINNNMPSIIFFLKPNAISEETIGRFPVLSVSVSYLFKISKIHLIEQDYLFYISRLDPASPKQSDQSPKGKSLDTEQNTEDPEDLFDYLWPSRKKAATSLQVVKLQLSVYKHFIKEALRAAWLTMDNGLFYFIF